MATLVCPNGHEWPGLSTQATGAKGPLACPVCGAEVLGPTFATGADAADATLHVETPALSRDLQAGTSVGGYEVLGVLGRGGMGVVYKALQPSLRRLVALKMIHADKSLDSAAFARFRREAEAIAQLQHANIVQIYEIGQHDGNPFFSLEYIDGGNLAGALKRTLPSVRQAAQFAELLAHAIHHAHERGIVHRDLKPGNILLQAADFKLPVANVSEDGADSHPSRHAQACDLKTAIPKITDFGLVKYVDQPDEPLTQSGVVLGTPSYMAPEQATGDAHRLGPATDVYAIGAILYEMLTGRPPFQGKTPLETLHQVVHEEPLEPRILRDGLPRDLETICLTCLNKEPTLRYVSATALANDLHLFLAGGSIQARPPGAAMRLRRWLQRHPLLALTLILGTVTGLGLVLGAFWVNALTVSVAVVLALVAGAGWYGARVAAALREAHREHVRAERNAQRLALLLETTNRLMTITQPDELLHVLSETTTRLLDAERATIFLVDKARGELWSKVALGENVGEIRVSIGQGIAGTAAATGETIVISDPYDDPRFNPDIDRRTGYVTRNLLTMPMTGEHGATLGVFQVLNKRGGGFGREDIDLLSSLAASAARVIEVRF